MNNHSSSSAASDKDEKGVITPVLSPGLRATKDDKGDVIIEREGVVHDAVFGDITDEGPNYRGLGWIRTAVLLIKVQIGLGVLGMPSVLQVLGMGPGVIIIFIVAFLTTWSNYVVVQFKLAYPSVYSVADIGYIMGGPWVRELLGGVYWIMLTAVSGAGMLGIATAFNQMSEHGACTVVFALVAAIMTFLVSSIRTLDRMSWVGWVGLAGIMGAVITMAIAVGVQDRPEAAPQVGPWDPQVVMWGKPTFLNAMSAVATIVFSFAGAPNFINILAEMKRPEDFKKSLALTQTFVTATYLIIGCVVYHYCGIYVSSPALGSAGPLLKKVCYGIALPGLIVGCVLNSHFTAKYTFLRICGRTEHVNSNSLKSWAVWLTFVFVNVAISFIIAEAIPFFGDLVSLIGALVSTSMCITTMGFMWLFLNRSRIRNRDQWTTGFLAMVGGNVLMITIGFLIQIAGTVSSVIAINNSMHNGGTTSPFSC
ncbi:hypothetical protein JCM6882_003714 [Rhodosporidiobolus microsporus]